MHEQGDGGQARHCWRCKAGQRQVGESQMDAGHYQEQ